MTFASIQGQEKAITVLKEFIRKGRIAGGYLFAGPDGVGKKPAALALAAAMNCEIQNDDTCGKCPSCRKIADGRHPDVHMISGGGADIKIEYVRELQREIGLKPFEARTKVFIIDDAHLLTAEAANALLKVLEEPPKHSVIILITGKTSLMFKTILSRCKVIRFSALARPLLEKILTLSRGVDAQSARILAYAAEGSLGRALRLHEEKLVQSRDAVIAAFMGQDARGVERLAAAGKDDARKALGILAGWFRDIYLYKTGADASEIIHIDRQADLARAGARFSPAAIYRIFAAMTAAAQSIEQNINLRLLLYNLCEEIRAAA